jgi:hypothetical protein
MNNVGGALFGWKAGIEIGGLLIVLRAGRKDGGAKGKYYSERPNSKFIHEVPRGRMDRWKHFGDKESVILPPGGNGKVRDGVWSSRKDAEIFPRKSVFLGQHSGE